MDKFLIKGGKALHGTVAISGAKNSALPVMAAALLTKERITLHNIPKVRDLITMSKLLAFMGAKVSITDIPASDYVIQAVTLSDAVAPYELVKTMRASILTLGPLMARMGIARVSLPGGCAIGARPVDLHLAALEKMGAEITTDHGYIQAKVPDDGRLKGANITFEKITVTGTENILMAAVLAEGETVLNNAAREPEVTDLADMLRKMGAQIEGDCSSTLRIRGVDKLHGTEHTVIPDRIEAGTFLVAGAITDGDLTLTNCAPDHLGLHHRQIGANGRAHRNLGQSYGARARRKETDPAPILLPRKAPLPGDPAVQHVGRRRGQEHRQRGDPRAGAARHQEQHEHRHQQQSQHGQRVGQVQHAGRRRDARRHRPGWNVTAGRASRSAGCIPGLRFAHRKR